MALKRFDQKFGKEFLSGVPTTPGVYSVHDASGTLVYVGKAKNLRKRLGQYRNAKRLKKHQKMRSIIGDAAEIRFEQCDTDLSACLLEARLIQERRPRWNVAGAFYFLYPLVALKHERGEFAICYTTVPDVFEGFQFHGAFRSRFITGEAFFSWMKLLSYVGHRIPPKRATTPKYSYVYRFRQIPEAWVAKWTAFWRGESLVAMEELVLALVENAGARKKGREVQDHLNNLKRFWNHEAKPLSRAIKATAHEAYPVSQRDRDIVFLKFRSMK